MVPRFGLSAAVLLLVTTSGCMGESPPPSGDDSPTGPAPLFSNFLACVQYPFGLRIDCDDVVSRTAAPGPPGQEWRCRATYPNDLHRTEMTLYEHESTGVLGFYLADANGRTHQGRVNVSVDGAQASLDATFHGSGFLPTGLTFGKEVRLDLRTDNLTMESNWPPFLMGSHRVVLIAGQPDPWFQVQIQTPNGTRYYVSAMVENNGRYGLADSWTILDEDAPQYHLKLVGKVVTDFHLGESFEDELIPPLSEPCQPKY